MKKPVFLLATTIFTSLPQGGLFARPFDDFAKFAIYESHVENMMESYSDNKRGALLKSIENMTKSPIRRRTFDDALTMVKIVNLIKNPNIQEKEILKACVKLHDTHKNSDPQITAAFDKMNQPQVTPTGAYTPTGSTTTGIPTAGSTTTGGPTVSILTAGSATTCTGGGTTSIPTAGGTTSAQQQQQAVQRERDRLADNERLERETQARIYDAENARLARERQQREREQRERDRIAEDERRERQQRQQREREQRERDRIAEDERRERERLAAQRLRDQQAAELAVQQLQQHINQNPRRENIENLHRFIMRRMIDAATDAQLTDLMPIQAEITNNIEFARQEHPVNGQMIRGLTDEDIQIDIENFMVEINADQNQLRPILQGLMNVPVQAPVPRQAHVPQVPEGVLNRQLGRPAYVAMEVHREASILMPKVEAFIEFQRNTLPGRAYPTNYQTNDNAWIALKEYMNKSVKQYSDAFSGTIRDIPNFPNALIDFLTNNGDYGVSTIITTIDKLIEQGIIDNDTSIRYRNKLEEIRLRAIENIERDPAYSSQNDEDEKNQLKITAVEKEKNKSFQDACLNTKNNIVNQNDIIEISIRCVFQYVRDHYRQCIDNRIIGDAITQYHRINLSDLKNSVKECINADRDHDGKSNRLLQNIRNSAYLKDRIKAVHESQMFYNNHQNYHQDIDNRGEFDKKMQYAIDNIAQSIQLLSLHEKINDVNADNIIMHDILKIFMGNFADASKNLVAMSAVLAKVFSEGDFYINTFYEKVKKVLPFVEYMQAHHNPMAINQWLDGALVRSADAYEDRRARDRISCSGGSVERIVLGTENINQQLYQEVFSTKDKKILFKHKLDNMDRTAVEGSENYKNQLYEDIKNLIRAEDPAILGQVRDNPGNVGLQNRAKNTWKAAYIKLLKETLPELDSGRPENRNQINLTDQRWWTAQTDMIDYLANGLSSIEWEEQVFGLPPA